ncbi:uncharacterized protein LOC116294719 [Actinia tenebrosa]|uniref:Uncharacterized protein LOC116294719 n=1 Tax=Actinia tenebrosa TaxID=6105 RepID=A0A6P8HPA8_ACTTE|nr:uncharacterized protein LOC116294719 [Actinia tenebrosa]
MSGAAVVAVREEKARFGNIEVTKETALVATEEGIVAIERHRIEEHQPMRALPPPQQQQASWYDPRGKGCCVGFLLMLMWIVIAVILLPFFILVCICYCCFGKDDD